MIVASTPVCVEWTCRCWSGSTTVQLTASSHGPPLRVVGLHQQAEGSQQLLGFPPLNRCVDEATCLNHLALSTPHNPTSPVRRSTLTAISRDETITILPAGKGRCTVILNTTDYRQEVISLLENKNIENHHQKLQYNKKTIACLKELDT